MISVTIPLRTVSEANRHEHWRARQRRAKEQRTAVVLVLAAEWFRKLGHRPYWTLKFGYFAGSDLIVQLTRLTARELDDDNLQGALKHVRDGVADTLGIDDRNPRVTWEYAQERAKGYAVRIEIRRREA